jgi:arylsulfatase A-like enzyme
MAVESRLMNRREFLRLAGTACVSPLLSSPLFPGATERPNIVLILSDDVGYGDLGCYGATRVRTPNLDRLAAQGVRFTDAHSSSATCTPSRYAIMTGEYPWRRKGIGILPGDAPLIVEPGRTTLPSMLQRAGYTTGCVGKWHLGLGQGQIDWNGEVQPGPLEIGFDYSYILPATGDRVPCVYVENHRVVGLDPRDPIRVSYAGPLGDEPTGRDHPELLRMRASQGHDQTIVNGIGRIGYMSGGRSARWVDEDMGATLTRKALSFIERSQVRPFFLYLASHDIHVPRVPGGWFRGTSQCGIRCDTIQQLDWMAGEVLATLDRLKLAQNTLVIFTSDNGPVLDDGYADGAVEEASGHQPVGRFRGGKYSIYEGGTRLPFLLRWPARVKPGVSAALVGQIDLLSSCAALVEAQLPSEAAPDSFNVLPALLGQSPRGRQQMVEHSGRLALRDGKWKYIAPAAQRAGQEPAQPAGELYDLAADAAETKNLIEADPGRGREMAALLDGIRSKPRSRP